MFGGRLSLAIIIAIFLVIPLVHAEDSININFNLYDFQTKEKISDTHVNLILYNPQTNKGINTVKFVGDNAVLNFQIEPGEWEFTLKIDDITTLGVDYYFKSTFELNENINEKLFLLPVGTVRGIVYDGKENILPNVDLKFECSGNYGDLRNKRTDSFGSFQKEWLPVGSCRISSLLEGVIGFEYVTVQQGKINNVEIILKQQNNKWYFLFVLIIFIILGLSAYLSRDALKNLAFFESKKEAKAKETEKTKEPEKDKGSSQIDTIMRTLNGKEKQVLKFLVENPKTTQAKIKNSTSIPKTTLARVLRSLEQKQLIKIDKIDRLKKVELNDWMS